jgi:hypothetical protein
MIAGLKRQAKDQSMLSFPTPAPTPIVKHKPKPKGGGKGKADDGLVQAQLSFQPRIKKNLEVEMRKAALNLLGLLLVVRSHIVSKTNSD